MNASRAASSAERLPWLRDEWDSRKRSGWIPLAIWTALATVVVAGASYWLGAKSALEDQRPGLAGPSSEASRVVRLPEPPPPPPPPRLAPPQVEPAPLPQVTPVAEPPPVPIAPARPVRDAPPKAERAEPRPLKTRAEAAPPRARAEPRAKARPARKSGSALQPWPADRVAGASGRMVRIGTFGSARQAKLGWTRLVRVYPGMRRLRAIVVPARSMRNNRVYYRLQFGTTSHAHSEVLCQRMRIVGQSCVVIGLKGRGGAAGA